jgi:DNA-binding response OmpR family regulator
MLKVLIVEDDVQISQMYKYKLELAGYKVALAMNGVEGLEAAEQFLPELILLDLLMPVMAGDEMLEILRSKKWSSNIRVIVLTNISKDEAPAKLRLLGVDRYIVKAHHTPSQILELIDELLSK